MKATEGASASRWTFRPLQAARWEEWERLMRTGRRCAACWCTPWRLTRRDFAALSAEQRRALMRGRVDRGEAAGIVAYADTEPVGWCSVGPRNGFRGIVSSPRAG